MISLYRILTFILFPVFLIVIYLRRFINKEDKTRYKEKISIKKNYYSKGKTIIWMHAASIGEVNSIISLIEEIIKKDKHIFILLTSTTLSSSQLIKTKKLDQENFLHLFFTIDVQFLVKKFLNEWKPKLVIFVDSEIWPNYLYEISKRNIPMMLLNGRITIKTYNRWKIFPKLSKKIFELYNLCLCSSLESEKNLRSLGAKNVKFIGNLKFSTRIESKAQRKDLQLLKDNCYIWTAASTHPGEEEIILKTHCILKKKDINLITIIIPRHISRSKEIYSLCKNFNLKAQIVDKYNDISKESEILIINSIGEMTEYFFGCKSIFMGKSLSKKLVKVGGQNPIEPAKCGCKIYHGPYVSNFEEIYNFLNKKKIAYEVSNELDLSENLIKDFKGTLDFNKEKISELNEYGEKILSLTYKEIFKLKNDN
tara:strand:- start:2266 stop:3537 length:1272 start_codon:yes stop_codon:yes gene_type:complete